jgi:hypothetical protein
MVRLTCEKCGLAGQDKQQNLTNIRLRVLLWETTKRGRHDLMHDGWWVCYPDLVPKR